MSSTIKENHTHVNLSNPTVLCNNGAESENDITRPESSIDVSLKNKVNRAKFS